MPSLWDALKQYLGDAAPGGALNPEVTPQGLLDTASLATSPVPVLGDMVGLLADVNRMRDPTERTWQNVGLLALGAVPFVPPMAGKLKKAAKFAPPSYQIAHRPMNVDGGAAQLFDAAKSFGDDVYGPNALQYFGSGDKREASVLKILRKVKGNPKAKVTIYRGIPDSVPHGINPGDWVTLDPRVAADYGRVVSMEVPASDVTTWADSLLEFGYFPTGGK